MALFTSDVYKNYVVRARIFRGGKSRCGGGRSVIFAYVTKRRLYPCSIVPLLRRADFVHFGITLSAVSQSFARPGGTSTIFHHMISFTTFHYVLFYSGHIIIHQI